MMIDRVSLEEDKNEYVFQRKCICYVNIFLLYSDVIFYYPDIEYLILCTNKEEVTAKGQRSFLFFLSFT